MCNDELTHEKIEVALEAQKRNSKKGGGLLSKVFGKSKDSTQVNDLVVPPSRPALNANDNDNPLRMSHNSHSSLASSIPVRMPPAPARIGMSVPSQNQGLGQRSAFE